MCTIKRVVLASCLTNDGSGILIDSNDGLVLIEGNLVGGDRELDWVGSLKYGVKFLELFPLLAQFDERKRRELTVRLRVSGKKK